MNNDELATRRAQAIAEDRCFSKGRLRDEFRMKPAPGAEPVKWYKNTYGGRFAVYRIADCVPMREKRPLTSKQLLAGQRLSVLSRLNSTSGRMARQAYDWLSLAPLFLDTETTGLDNTAEALEIGLTDASGQVVFETRLKPTVAIGAQAAAVHGISEQALCGAPSWTDVARQLRHAIGDRPVIIFNARFDIRILKQTAAAHSDPADRAGRNDGILCDGAGGRILWGHQPLWHDFTGQCCQPGRIDLGRAGTLSDRRRTDDGRGGKRYCCISSGTAAGTGTAENLTAWPVYRNHLRYPDVNPPLVAVSMLMLMYVYISINEG